MHVWQGVGTLRHLPVRTAGNALSSGQQESLSAVRKLTALLLANAFLPMALLSETFLPTRSVGRRFASLWYMPSAFSVVRSGPTFCTAGSA